MDSDTTSTSNVEWNKKYNKNLNDDCQENSECSSNCCVAQSSSNRLLQSLHQETRSDPNAPLVLEKEWEPKYVEQTGYP